MISLNGNVEVNGDNVGTIAPVTVDNLDQLEKIGSAMFRVPEGVTLQPADNSTVQQGFLEAANVDIVREMIDMIISFRQYEADSKSIQVQDQSLDHLFNRVGTKG